MMYKMTTKDKVVDALKAGGVAMLVAGIKEFRREMSNDGFDLDHKMQDTVREAKKMVDKTAKLARKKAQEIMSEVQKEMIEPTTDRVERAWHELSVPRRRVPTWVMFALGSIGAGAVVYGLAKSDRVREFAAETLRMD